jgi:hypothetical protein
MNATSNPRQAMLQANIDEDGPIIRAAKSLILPDYLTLEDPYSKRGLSNKI